MGLEQYTGQLDYNKDIQVDTGELEKSIKAGNFEKKDFLETMALYLKEPSYQHALEESLKTSLQTLWAQRNPAVVRFVETYNLQRLFIAPPLQLKENYENIGHAKLVDRFKKNYPKQYAEIEAKAKRDNADRDQLVQRDYVDYEVAMAALDTYFGLLQPEEESIAKEMGFKDLREFNEFAFKYRTAARMIENITNRHHPDIDKKMKIWAEYCKKSTDITKKTGYDKPGIYAQHLDYYKTYEAKVAAVPGFDPGLYAEAQKVLEDGYVGLDSESALQSRMNANNYVRYCSEEIQKLQKAAGPLMIKGFLSFNRQMNGLQETYERKYKISAVQAEIEKYTATCDGFYAMNQISLADAGRVGKVLTRMEESGLNKKYQDITALYRYIADPTNKDGPFRAIVLDRKLKQAEQLKKQQEIDASYTWIRKTFGSGVYTVLNAGAGLRNGFYDAIVGTGSALGAMIISFFKDDKAMGSTLRLKESWDAFGKIGLASEMSEPLVKDGKLNMRFDNTVNQLAQGISQMIALLGGGEARARGAEKAGAGLLKLTTKTGGVLVQNASRIGLFSNAMIQQAGTNYLSAKAQGLTDMESVAYSLFSSAGSAGLELLSPNDVVTGKFSGVLLSLVGKEGKARIMTKLALFAMTALATGKNLLAAGKNLAYELKDEVIQEETQGLFTSVFNYIVNSGADINLDVNMSRADLGSTAIITALTTGVVSGSGSYQQGKIDTGNMTQTEKENLKRQIAAVPEMRAQYTKQIDEMLVKPPAGVDVEALKQLRDEINNAQGNGNTNMEAQADPVPAGKEHAGESEVGEQQDVEKTATERKTKRNALGLSEWMTRLKEQKDRVVAKFTASLMSDKYRRAIVDIYQAYFKDLNDRLFALSGYDESYDHIDREFCRNLTPEQADMIHQMHLLSWDDEQHRAVYPDGTPAIYPGTERITSESELNAFKGRNLLRVINNPFIVRQLLEYKICGAANSPGVPIVPIIDADATGVAGAEASGAEAAGTTGTTTADVKPTTNDDASTTETGVQPTTTEVNNQTATDQTVADQTATTEVAVNDGEVQLDNLRTETQQVAADADALAEEIQKEPTSEKQKNALVRYLKSFVKQLQKAKDVALQAKFAVTDLVTAKSIADGLDAMIAFCQAIITGIDLSKKMTESRWNTYKFSDELKNTGGITKLRINIWGLFFHSWDMMSAHEKGLRSLMKDVLEYFCYVLVRVKVTLEDIQVTEEHELPEKERARREKLKKYEEKRKKDRTQKFNEQLETEFGLKAKVDRNMQDMGKVIVQIKLTIAKIDEKRQEMKSQIRAIEAAIEEIQNSSSDAEGGGNRIREMESSLIKCNKKLEKLQKEWEKRAAIKMRAVTFISSSKLTKGEYALIKDEMLKTEKKKIKKKGITLDLSLEVRKEKARVWKEAEKELRKTNKKFKLTEAKKDAIREAHMRGYGTEEAVKNPDGTPVLDGKGSPVMEYPQAVRLTKTRIMMEATEPDGSRCFTNEEIKRLGDKGIFGFLNKPGNKNVGQDTKVDLVSLKRPGLELYVDREKTQGIRIRYKDDQLPPTYHVEGLGGLDTYRNRVFVQGGEGAQERAKQEVARLVMEKTGIKIVVKGDNDWEVHGVTRAPDGSRVKAEGNGKESQGQEEGTQEKKPSRVRIKKPPRIKVKKKNEEPQGKPNEGAENKEKSTSESLDEQIPVIRNYLKAIDRGRGFDDEQTIASLKSVEFFNTQLSEIGAAFNIVQAETGICKGIDFGEYMRVSESQCTSGEEYVAVLRSVLDLYEKRGFIKKNSVTGVDVLFQNPLDTTYEGSTARVYQARYNGGEYAYKVAHNDYFVPSLPIYKNMLGVINGLVDEAVNLSNAGHAGVGPGFYGFYTLPDGRIGILINQITDFHDYHLPEGRKLVSFTSVESLMTQIHALHNTGYSFWGDAGQMSIDSQGNVDFFDISSLKEKGDSVFTKWYTKELVDMVSLALANNAPMSQTARAAITQELSALKQYLVTMGSQDIALLAKVENLMERVNAEAALPIEVVRSEKEITFENARVALGDEVYEKLTSEQRNAIWAAHLVGVGQNGADGLPAGKYKQPDGSYKSNFTPGQMREKVEILQAAGLSEGQRRTLLEKGVCGLEIEAVQAIVALTGEEVAPGSPQLDLIQMSLDSITPEKLVNIKRLKSDIENVLGRKMTNADVVLFLNADKAFLDRMNLIKTILDTSNPIRDLEYVADIDFYSTLSEGDIQRISLVSKKIGRNLSKTEMAYIAKLSEMQVDLAVEIINKFKIPGNAQYLDTLYSECVFMNSSDIAFMLEKLPSIESIHQFFQFVQKLEFHKMLAQQKAEGRHNFPDDVVVRESLAMPDKMTTLQRVLYTQGVQEMDTLTFISLLSQHGDQNGAYRAKVFLNPELAKAFSNKKIYFTDGPVNSKHHANGELTHGLFVSSSQNIYLNLRTIKNFDHVASHEIIHLLTLDYLVNQKSDPDVKKLESIFENLKKEHAEHGEVGWYGFKNVYEFVAELSNPQFVAYLHKLINTGRDGGMLNSLTKVLSLLKSIQQKIFGNRSVSVPTDIDVLFQVIARKSAK